MSYSTVVLPSGGHHTLSPAASRLLANLEWRADIRDGVCWLVHTARGRYALVVPVDYSVARERLRGVDRATVRELEALGLIELGADGPAPAYGYRDPGDRRTGRTVVLTTTARTARAGGAR